MGIHTGPKDGDYARYVEVLTSGSEGEPGKVYTSRRAAPTGWAVESEVPPLPDGFKPAPVAINPLVTPGANPAASVTTPRARTARSDATLAARGTKRTVSVFFRIIAIALIVAGANLIMGALADDMSGGEGVIPGAFLLVFALMLFKAASGLGRDATRASSAAVRPMPPLTTLSAKHRPDR